jgi:phosphatidylglycerophosphate synthase
MPAPTSVISSDAVLYDWIYTPLAKHLCFMDPNHITVACFLLLIPLVYGLLHHWPLWVMILIMFIRQSMDCLDGAVARTCNKTSKFGAILDLSEDIVTSVVLGGLLLWMLWKKSYSSWVLALFAAIYIYGLHRLITHIYLKIDGESKEFNSIEKLYHDNTVVLLVGFIYVFYRLVN